MSARQNKKQRKGRNNPNNRERTVTTLTEDPNTPNYLVPTPSEEPAGANLMSSPFSVASSSGGNSTNMNPPGFNVPGNFGGFGFNNFGGPMHGNVHQQPAQQQFFNQQQSTLPPGQNDLEILEKLKETIKSGQHEFYRAVPQPAALLNIYLGSSNASQVPHHPDQPPPEFQPGPGYQNGFDGSPKANPSAQGNSGPTSPVAEFGRRPPRLQNKETWEVPTRNSAPQTPVSASQVPNNVPSIPDQSVFVTNTPQYLQSANQGVRKNNGVTPINTGATGNYTKNPAARGQPSAGLQSATDMSKPSPITGPLTAGLDASQRSARFDAATNNSPSSRPSGPPMNTIKSDQQRNPGDRGESYGGERGPSSDAKMSVDDPARTPREVGWSHRDGVPPDDRRRDSDRPPNNTSNGADLRSAGGAYPPTPSRDSRYSDPRDRDRDRERDRERDRDWERDRRDDFRGRDDRRPADVRRPLPEQRHYEPGYDRAPPRRLDSKDDLADDRRMSDSTKPPLAAPVDDRSVRPPHPNDRSSVDDRVPVRAPLATDSRDARAPIAESRAPPPDNRPRGPPIAQDDRSSRVIASRAPEGSGPSRPSDDRGGRIPPDDDRNPRHPVPLEDRISRPPPSLQERINLNPPPARTESNRSLEERLSTAPAPSTDRTGRSSIPSTPLARPAGGLADRDRTLTRSGPADERNTTTASRGGPPEPSRLPPVQDERPSRPDDRSTARPGDRFVTPARPTSYPVSRAASVTRDEPRIPPKVEPRGFRSPPRSASRDRIDLRSGGGNNYRPDADRYNDDRRTDSMDVDPPSSRYNDRQYGRFSPPSAADLARDRERARRVFPPSPPRPAPDPPAFADDRDRRGPPPARDWLGPIGERRRDWSAAEEDSYWKSRPNWDRNNPPSAADRDRYDRDHRDPPPPPPPPVAAGRPNGWETREERERRSSFPPPRSPPSRSSTFDTGRPPLSSRLADYPPARETYLDRPTYSASPPPFNRVRQRSLSPVRRPGAVDDLRPPVKRPRDDAYPATYFSPGDAGRRPSDYPPPRAPSPPSNGSGYYDHRPPPSSSSTVATPGNSDRDYPRDYPSSGSYDRPRSPARVSQSYNRNYVPPPRDDRSRYMPPPRP